MARRPPRIPTALNASRRYVAVGIFKRWCSSANLDLGIEELPGTVKLDGPLLDDFDVHWVAATSRAHFEAAANRYGSD